jgi:serine/threonine protein kinase
MYPNSSVVQIPPCSSGVRTFEVVIDHLIGVAEGLLEIRSAGFVHGDLKAANCLVSGDVIKVTL